MAGRVGAEPPLSYPGKPELGSPYGTLREAGEVTVWATSGLGVASGTQQRALISRVRNGLPLLALTQLLLLWERLALTFKQLWEQAVSLELPQEKMMSSLSPGPPHAAATRVHVGTVPWLRCAALRAGDGPVRGPGRLQW